MSRSHWLAACIAVLCCSEAHTSQVHLEAITLAQLVERSDVVVVAEPAVPPSTTIAIDITPSGQVPDPKRWPPFSRVKERWRIIEVLRDAVRHNVPVTPGPALKAGMVVEVDSAVWGSDLWNHRSYYLEGMSESPIYDAFHDPTPTTKAVRILCLQRQDEGLAFAVVGASVVVERRAEVVAALRPPGPAPAR
jgi:hypothetical protein